jgi:ribosomal protein S17
MVEHERKSKSESQRKMDAQKGDDKTATMERREKKKSHETCDKTEKEKKKIREHNKDQKITNL